MNVMPLDMSVSAEVPITPEFSIPVMPRNPQLANAYVPYQVMCKIYEPMKALMKGTIFPELVRPYEKHKHER